MDAIWFFDQLALIRVSGEQTAGRYAVCEITAPPGSQTPLHLHHDEEEGFAVLEGEATFWVGDETFVLRAGEFAEAPRELAHCWQNTGDGDVRMLVTTAPAGFDAFVRELGRPAAHLGLPDDGVMPDPETIGRVAAAHAIEILGPPGMRPADLAGAASA